MNAWPFVIAAYAVALGGIAIVTLLSWRAMRQAEQSGADRSDRSSR